MPDPKRILVTGATGYIGGRLVPKLLEAGYRVRCTARDPRKLDSRRWRDDPRVEVAQADVLDIDSLQSAMSGCSAAYYLIHSMIVAGGDYERTDNDAALNFACAAPRCGIERIIYLGGLGETGAGLSDHLASRRQVERILGDGTVPVTTLRAAMIIGSASASFEILRYLTERLPFMVTPKWVDTECQPIAIANALGYLVDALSVPETAGRTLDIGGPDVRTYRELLQSVARALDLKPRRIVPLPVLTPKLSSLWIHLVTPVGSRIARPLAEGLKNRVVCRNDEAQRLLPQPLVGVEAAIDAALRGSAETSWSDAGIIPGDPDWAGGKVYEDTRAVLVQAPPHTVFSTLCRLGGQRGWFSAGWLWQVRGLIDRLLGGPGLVRGRRDPENVAYGDALDFWRVTEVVRDQKLSLRGELRLPGEALLEFRVDRHGDGISRLVQTARFKPRGLAGLAYWQAVRPFHAPVFRAMIRGVQQEAERDSNPNPRKSS